MWRHGGADRLDGPESSHHSFSSPPRLRPRQVPAGATLTIEPGTAIYAMREQASSLLYLVLHVDTRLRPLRPTSSPPPRGALPAFAPARAVRAGSRLHPRLEACIHPLHSFPCQEPVSILVLEHGRVDARGTIDAPIRLLAPPWLEPQVMPHRAGATPRSAPPSTMSVFAHIKAEFGAPRFRIGSLAEIERCDAHCYAPTTFPTTSAWNLITPPRAPPPPSPPRPPPSPPPLPPSG